ncbi:ABC transporter permease subunit [Agrilactobacillus yilanensis]|uniref:ABC transporter permease subunit n=1 Tax=Agrilactobacillus yilanensis TaxID=2485997 RepID=A0ABW4J691_9LACO|nr:ABC transporter permease subunit [Agrilactobacillus yilanensis]
MFWEWQQWTKSWWHWLFLGLCIGLIFGAYSYFDYQAQVKLQQTKQQLKAEYTQINNDLESTTSSNQLNAQQKQQLKTSRVVLNNYYTALKTKPSTRLVKARLQYFKNERRQQQLGLSNANYTQAEIKFNIARDQYLQQKKLPPITHYEKPSILMFHVYLWQSNLLWLLIGLLILQGFPIFARDYEQGTLKLLYTLPKPRKRIFNAKHKLLTSIIGSELLLLGLLASVIAGISSHKLGYWQYPLAFKAGHVLTVGHFLLGALILAIGLLLVGSSCLRLISNLMKDRFTTVLLCSAVLFVPIFFGLQKTSSWQTLLVPFVQLSFYNHLQPWMHYPQIIGLAFLVDLSFALGLSAVAHLLETRYRFT